MSSGSSCTLQIFTFYTAHLVLLFNPFVRNPVAKDLLDWLRDTEFPDESFHSTLIRVRFSGGGQVVQVRWPREGEKYK